MGSVQTFAKDYCNLLKHEMKFYKNHWKGALAVNMIILGGVAAGGAIHTAKQEKAYKKYHHKNDEIKIEYKVEKDE